MSALIYKITKAKKENLPSVEIWGTGKARREFLYNEDVADAMIFFMKKYNAKDLPAFINIGSGSDVTIKELAFLIKDAIVVKQFKYDSVADEPPFLDFVNTVKTSTTNNC